MQNIPKSSMRSDVIIIGGGAAGIFAAVAAGENASVILLERSSQLLSKVKISGGGRCNVTHACFEPRQLVQNYPRGNKELIGPFSTFQPKDTIEWFESRGVQLKVEDDGRMFPITDSSSSIIECLLKEAHRLNIDIRRKQHVQSVHKENDLFQIVLEGGEILECRHLLLATGSSPQGHSFAKSFGHTIQDPVPSLFTFNAPNFQLKELAGISVEKAKAQIADTDFAYSGPLLITHWGFSGPAILKLSAWAARELHAKKYQFELIVDWFPEKTNDALFEVFRKMRQATPNQSIASQNLLPKNLWKKFLEVSSIDGKKRTAEISNHEISKLCEKLKSDRYAIDGKTTHKEEFVTCGGVTLSEINFKKMESRKCDGLFFAGEVLDIDGITGGFNFQNAWTTGWLAGKAMASPI